MKKKTAMMMTVGIDAHKRSCTACTFEDLASRARLYHYDAPFRYPGREGADALEGSSEFEEIRLDLVLSKLLSERYQVHMIAPPETKPSIKTNKGDAEKIAKEDMLGYTRRCYIPSKYIEEMRSLAARQMRLGKKISGVRSHIHSLLESNMMQSEFEDLSDIFGVEGLERMANLRLPDQVLVELGMRLQELNLYVQQHAQVEIEVARMAGADEDCRILMSHPGMAPFTSTRNQG